MTDGWRVARLGDVCSFEKEQDIHADLPYVGLENIESGTGRFLGTTNAVSVKSATFRFSPAHVLYGRLRPYLNKVLLPRFEGHCSTEIFPIKPGPEISRDYLFHWLSMDATVKAIDATATGARMPRANMNAVLDFDLPVPPLPEQRRIVAILDEAFEGIATAKANAGKSLRNVRELFSSYLESAFAQLESTASIEKLGQLCEFEGGSQPPKSEFLYAPRSGYVRFLQIRDFGTDRHETYIPEMKKNRLCNASDILIGRYGASVGKILTGKAGAYNVALMKTVPNLSLLDPEFFHRYLTSGAFQSRLINVAARSAQDGFSKEDIFGFPVPLPSLADQRAIVEQIDPVHEDSQRLADIYERKLAALDELKKSLLHQAFSGAL